MNTLNDIFKKSFLEGYSNTEITPTTVAVALMITCVIALYIFFIYRIITKKTFYSKTFNITLAGITVITAAIILTIQTSVVISLGMVGALSIVRFRTAIKDPMDLMFLFWSISVGIICGAGQAEIAVILSVVLTVGIFVLDRVPVAKAPMILVVNAADIDTENCIIQVVEKYTKYFKVKSRNMTSSTLDLVIELRTSDGGNLMKEVMNVENVSAASLLSHDGEVTF